MLLSRDLTLGPNLDMGTGRLRLIVASGLSEGLNSRRGGRGGVVCVVLVGVQIGKIALRGVRLLRRHRESLSLTESRSEALLRLGRDTALAEATRILILTEPKALELLHYAGLLIVVIIIAIMTIVALAIAIIPHVPHIFQVEGDCERAELVMLRPRA